MTKDKIQLAEINIAYISKPKNYCKINVMSYQFKSFMTEVPII